MNAGTCHGAGGAAASPSADAASLFRRIRLGYVLVESRKLDDWWRFGEERLGAHVDRTDDDALVYRIDRHLRRLIVRDGPIEDVAALGSQLDHEHATQLALQRLRVRGITVEPGPPEEAALRGVAQYRSFAGPKRIRVELFVHPLYTPVALSMRASGCVTGVGGMGHVAITTREPEAMQAFWREVFDARLSDHIEERLNGVLMELTFLRVNQRHHSVATAATRGVRLTAHRDVDVVRARYLIGCDGGRSTVRSLLGIKLAGTSFPNPWLLLERRLKDGEQAFRHLPYFSFYLKPEQPTISVPQPDGHHRFEFMLVSGQTREYMEDPATVRRLLAEHIDVDKVEILRKLVYTFNALTALCWILMSPNAGRMRSK